MLRYLVRYEIARLLLSGPGLALAALVGLALLDAASHWQAWALAIAIPCLRAAARKAGRRRYR